MCQADNSVMARHLGLVAIFLLLVSCISVEDFGVYWDKGVIDPMLEGSWKKTGLPDMEKLGVDIDDIPGPDRLVFVKDRTSYAMRVVNPMRPDLPADVAAQRTKDNARVGGASAISGVVDIAARVGETLESARWGASCPRQGSLSHPPGSNLHLEPSSGLT